MALEKMRTKVLIGLAVAGCLLFGAVGVAAADTSPQVTINGGLLRWLVPYDVTGDFTDVTLDGQQQTTTAPFASYSMVDADGNRAGWNVTVSATQFREHDGGGYVAGGETLPASSLSMPQTSVTAGPFAGADPTITPGPYSIDSGTAVKIASADNQTGRQGRGMYEFSGGDLTLTLSADVYAATYQSDITVSLNTGP